MNIGITSKETGDAEHGTASAKSGKDDPGSSHPARTDNESLDGHKYSSLLDQFQDLSKTAAALGNDLVAEIAAEAHAQTKAAQSTPAAKLAAAAQPVAAEKDIAPAAEKSIAPVAKQAEVAADEPVFDKQAVDNQLVASLANTILAAQDSAVKVAEVIRGYTEQQAAIKRAEEEGGGPPSHEAGEGPSQEKREDAGNGGPPSHSATGGPPPNPTDSGATPGGR